MICVLIKAALLTPDLPAYQGSRALGHQQLQGMKKQISMGIRREMIAIDWLQTDTRFLKYVYSILLFCKSPRISLKIQKWHQAINEKLESEVMYPSFLKIVLQSLMIYPMTATNYQYKIKDSGSESDAG